MNQALSLVVPVFEEAGNLRPLHNAIVAALDGAGLPFECIYVDDGSTDASPQELRAARRRRRARSRDPIRS